MSDDELVSALVDLTEGNKTNNIGVVEKNANVQRKSTTV